MKSPPGRSIVSTSTLPGGSTSRGATGAVACAGGAACCGAAAVAWPAASAAAPVAAALFRKSRRSTEGFSDITASRRRQSTARRGGGSANRLLGRLLDPRGEQRARIRTPSDPGTTLRAAGPAAGQRGRTRLPPCTRRPASPCASCTTPDRASRAATSISTAASSGPTAPDQIATRSATVKSRIGTAMPAAPGLDSPVHDEGAPGSTSQPTGTGTRRSAEIACHSSFSTASSSPTMQPLGFDARQRVAQHALVEGDVLGRADEPRDDLLAAEIHHRVGHADVGAVLGACPRRGPGALSPRPRASSGSRWLAVEPRSKVCVLTSSCSSRLSVQGDITRSTRIAISVGPESVSRRDLNGDASDEALGQPERDALGVEPLQCRPDAAGASASADPARGTRSRISPD